MHKSAMGKRKRPPAGRDTKINMCSPSGHQQALRERARKLTLCLFLLVGAIASLTPFLSLHLTNRVGLLLFESDLIQLRSSALTVIICLVFIVLLYCSILLTNRRHARRRNEMLSLQRQLKLFVGSFAIASVLFYLALALVVPQLRQIQRTPVATFDCSANLITIENCQQQFSTPTSATTRSHLAASGLESMSILDTIEQLILGDLNGNSERLAKKLECLTYNTQHASPVDSDDRKDEQVLLGGGGHRVPTRFLLHKCGLVCQPQRQHLHQFSDDLNTNERVSSMTAPYSRADEHNLSQMNSDNNSDSEDEAQTTGGDNLVSLKLCFSDEVNSGASNYKRFCIENLTNGGDNSAAPSRPSAPFSSQQDKTLTVGQLNAVLSRVRLDELAAPGRNPSAIGSDYQNVIAASSRPASLVAGSPRLDQSTHYVNPIVQFESHFKNWPQLRPDEDGDNDEQQHRSAHFHQQATTNPASAARPQWCKFKPLPPFIVNNKPFTDIRCSLDHEYSMSTGPPSSQLLKRRRQTRDRIYLKKWSSSSSGAGLGRSERCSIKCKVDILYQASSARSSQAGEMGARLLSSSSNSYYLPLKSCLIVVGDGDKTRTATLYLIFRSLADASLLLAFILVDVLLLIESVATKQFQLEGNKSRLLSLLVAVSLLPLIAALLFDLTAAWLPQSPTASSGGTKRSYRDGQLISWVNERLIPLVSETLERAYSKLTGAIGRSGRQPAISSLSLNATLEQENQNTAAVRQELTVDNYLVPFFIYALFMFALAINSFKLPLVGLKTPLICAVSTEELGMSQTSRAASRVQQQTNGGVARGESRDNKASLGAKHRDADKSERGNRSGARRAAMFAMLTLFMGLQFNLSQVTQTQILLESFNIQTDLIQQQNQIGIHRMGGGDRKSSKMAVWFVLVAHSSGALFVLILALLFSDELSVFLSQFAPFKQMPTAVESRASLSVREANEMRFRKYLSIALIIYSIRYFVLANMSPLSRVRWFLVILFQVTELLNFPLSWFVLSSRAHELLAEEAAQEHVAAEESRAEGPGEVTPASARLLNLHVLVQSALAFAYFALARCLALFLHSFHASLYLHSDNVHWFISTFYEARHKPAPPSNSTSAGDQQPPAEALFAPLPSERQTYLHASRSFIKFNSLVCLLVGSVLFARFAQARHKVWRTDRERRRLEGQLAARRSPQSDRDSDLIDERLSADLVQIHSSSSRLPTRVAHLPRSMLAGQERRGQSSNQDDDAEKPRARIHFRYDLGVPQQPNSSISGASSSSSSSIRRASLQIKCRPKELQIPILIKGGDDNDDDNELADETTTTNVERVKRVRMRRVRIVEDGDDWSLGSDSACDERGRQGKSDEGNKAMQPGPSDIMATSPPPPGFRDDDNDEAAQERARNSPNDDNQRQKHFPTSTSDDSGEELAERLRKHPPASELSAISSRNRRTISFAPTATFIDQHGAHSTRQQRQTSRSESDASSSGGQASERRPRQRFIASPEPSIDELAEHDDGHDDHEPSSIAGPRDWRTESK